MQVEAQVGVDQCKEFVGVCAMFKVCHTLVDDADPKGDRSSNHKKKYKKTMSSMMPGVKDPAKKLGNRCRLGSM